MWCFRTRCDHYEMSFRSFKSRKKETGGSIVDFNGYEKVIRVRLFSDQ